MSPRPHWSSWQRPPLPDLSGKKVILKPNFNSDDPFPATTHLDTLRFVIRKVKERSPASITILERSGLVAKWGNLYNYMWELHVSPNQRLMIAEINKYIPNHLVIIDGLKGFATEGPDEGRLIESQIMILSEDRVAADAVGVGVKSAEEIELVPVNPEAEEFIVRVKPFLSTAP